MTSRAFRALALSLPEAHEAPHFERASFRVGKKLFATMTADGTEAMVRVADRELLEALLQAHSETFFSYGGWTDKNGALGVRLAKAEAALLRELVTDAWRRIAPKRAQAALSARR